MPLLLPHDAPGAGSEHTYFSEFDPKLGWKPVRNFSALHQRYGLAVRVHQN